MLKPGYNAAMAQTRQNLNPVQQKDALLGKVQGTKFAEPLMAAAKRGDDSFASTYYIMSQSDPDFRSLLDSDGGDEGIGPY